MAACCPPEYHDGVDDLRAELAELVADTLATAHALRLQGVLLVPVESRQNSARSPLDDDARTAREVEVGAPPPPVERPVAVAVPPRRPAPVVAPSPALAPPPAGGLLGKWKERLLTPEERLQRAVATLPERCEGCGLPCAVGTGGARSGVVLVAPAAEGAEATMLGNMLLNVVGLEPADTWRLPSRSCARCVEAMRVQVEALRPRVVLVLGQEAARALELPELGQLARFGGCEAVATWHPGEITEDPSRKRAAFEVLKLVAARR